MTTLGNSGPGLAGQDEDTFTQNNTILAGKAPTLVSYGYTVDDLAQYSLVGRVTETGELKLSAFAAADGSQNPIGVTTHAVTVGDAADSNSLADSNSAGVSDAHRVGFYRDGTFNYDMLALGAGWTVDLLRRNLELNGCQIGVDQIQTATPTEPTS